MISAGQLISERVMLKRDRYFAVSARDGSIRPGEFLGDGLWFEDTRILSGLRVLIDGLEPRADGLRNDESSATFELESGWLRLTRERFLDDGLHERITLTNTGSTIADAVLEVEVASDFAAMLGLRGAVPALADPVPVEAKKTVEGVRFERDGNAVDVRLFPEGLKHQVRLRAAESFVLQLDVGHTTPDFAAGLEAARDIYTGWAAECMSIQTDNPALNDIFERATADVRLLLNRYSTGIYPTAGLPWYAVPFGRDALITAILLLHVNPEVARGVLRYLAANQGKRVDPDSEEQPGKILHEVRTGAVVEGGYWPHILYGTIDATPLFLCALAETEAWTVDHAAKLKRSFNRDFWMPKEKFLAQALDGHKRQVQAITSSPGHCLWMRAVDAAKAARVTQRMMSPELFTGWGIRTLSER